MGTRRLASIDYIRSRYITADQLSAKCAIPVVELWLWIDRECMPGPSYVLSAGYNVESFFGSRLILDEPIHFFPKANVGLWGELSALREAEAQRPLSAVVKENFRQRYLNQLASEPAWRNGLFENRDVPGLVESEWRLWLDGVYGLCTKTAKPEDIATKEACIREIKALVGDDAGVGLAPENREGLEAAVTELNRVAAEFAPDEYRSSSRYLWIDRVVERYELELPEVPLP